MDPTLAAYSAALAISCLLSLVLAVVGFFRREVAGAVSFLFCNLSCFFYAFGSLIEIRATTIAGVMTALTTEYLGITTLGPLLLLTSLAATGNGRPFRRRTPLLFVVPVLIFALVSTNPYHHLYYSGVELTALGPFTVPVLDKGPFWMLQFAYLNFCIGWAVLASLQASRQASGDQRKALRLLLLGTLVPWAGMLWYQLGLSPWHLDTAPFGLSVTGIVVAVALFRYRLFDLRPLVADQVFANMREGVMVIDTKRRLLGINPALTKILPPMDQRLVGSPVEELFKTIPSLQSIVDAESANGGDLEIVSGDQRKIFQIDRSPLLDPKGRQQGTIYLFSDITQRQHLSVQLSRLARTDELTGLPNRRSFLERLEEALERHQRHTAPFALAIADIDHFKRINDSWGHAAGDGALVYVSSLWNSCLRASDLLARYGGEEFTVLMPRSSVSDALLVLERMRSRLQATPFFWQGKAIPITASFGLAIAGTDDTIEHLIRKADVALYWVKAHGRNQIKILDSPENP